MVTGVKIQKQTFSFLLLQFVDTLICKCTDYSVIIYETKERMGDKSL